MDKEERERREALREHILDGLREQLRIAVEELTWDSVTVLDSTISYWIGYQARIGAYTTIQGEDLRYREGERAV